MITRLDLWDDTGYTESGVERPPIGSVLPSPDHTIYDLRPDKNALFSQLALKGAFTDLMNTSYLRAEYDSNNGEPLTIYGWVDMVALRSDTEDFPMTVISWHPDLWRTFNSQALFKAGTVRRRPAMGEMPPQPYSVRYRTVTSSEDLLPDSDIWFFFNIVEQANAGHTTAIRACCCPFKIKGQTGPGSASGLWIANNNGSNPAQAMNFSQVMTGLMDECLGIDPAALVCACISPIPPMPYTGSGSEDDPIKIPRVDISTWYVDSGRKHSQWNYFISVTGQPQAEGMDAMYEYSGTLSDPIRTNDTESYSIRWLDGSTAGVLPWGLTVKDYKYRLLNEVTDFYIQIRFDGIDSSPEGLCFTIPLAHVAITSNSWNSYLYSGQREYEIQMRNLNSNRQLAQGLMSTVSNIGGQMTNAASTEMMGSMTQTMAAEAGAVAPAVAGLPGLGLIALGVQVGGSLIGTAGNYAMDTMYFNREFQRWEDYRAAMQTDNILTQGNSADIAFHGAPLSIVCMSSDDYSRTQRDTDISMYGCHVCEPKTSCQSIVEAGGPLQITNLTVGGDIPVQAKEYMRVMFSNGVRLV